MSKKKNHSKYDLGNFNESELAEITMKTYFDENEDKQYWDVIPEEMLLSIDNDSGFFFGMRNCESYGSYVGIPTGTEGNILVVGGNGSGKSSSIAKPTLRTWNGAICVTDVKGELSDYYAELYEKHKVHRDYIIFDPMNPNSLSYDPFWWLLKDDSCNFFSNIMEIVLAIVPNLPEETDTFWTKIEQRFLATVLIYYYNRKLSFSQAVCMFFNSTFSNLCDEIAKSNDYEAKRMLGEIYKSSPKTIACIDAGLRNKLMPFAFNPYVSHAFRGEREDAKCFNWGDIEKYNIFIRIPENRIDICGAGVTLMYTQLIRYLERKPDKYSTAGRNNIQTLLLMDEFPRFGKLEVITSGIATLRSKNVNICLMIQSLAQLDKIYGVMDRRIILDNCQYKAILGANDSDTQKYFSELIGTTLVTRYNKSENTDELMDTTTYGKQRTEIREYKFFPHELSSLKNIILSSPYGFHYVRKIQPFDIENMENHSIPVIYATARIISHDEICDENIPVIQGTARLINTPKIVINTDNVKILSFEERVASANKRILDAAINRSSSNVLDNGNEQECYCIIGEVITQYFPQLLEFEFVDSSTNTSGLNRLKNFLTVLSSSTRTMNSLMKKVSEMNA